MSQPRSRPKSARPRRWRLSSQERCTGFAPNAIKREVAVADFDRSAAALRHGDIRQRYNQVRSQIYRPDRTGWTISKGRANRLWFDGRIGGFPRVNAVKGTWQDDHTFVIDGWSSGKGNQQSDGLSRSTERSSTSASSFRAAPKFLSTARRGRIDRDCAVPAILSELFGGIISAC